MPRPEVRRRSRSDQEPEFVLSVDLGYAQDYTALALVQRVEVTEQDALRAPQYHVRMLKRFPLRTETPAIIADLCDYVQWRPVRDKIQIVVDASGSGTPIYQEMRRARLRSM